MKIFIETLSLEEIREIAEWGILHGVNTNSSFMTQEERRDHQDIIYRISQLFSLPLFVEVKGTKSEVMLSLAQELVELGDDIVIKVPMIEEGLKAVRLMKKEGIKTNVTLVFSPQQALLAALAGADYVSSFVGRLDDRGHDGIETLKQIVHLFELHQCTTQIISGGIRTVQHVYQSFYVGAQIASIPYEVLKKMIKHPLTDVGMKRFLKDWEEI